MPQVVSSLFLLDEFDAPVYNQIHQEPIVAGETTQNTLENPVVQEQVVVQEILEAPQVVDSFPLLGDVAARDYNQVLQSPVIFQEIPEVQIVERIQTALNTSSTSTSSGVLAATHAATSLATTDDDPIPPILDDEQMLLGYQAQSDQCVRMLKTKKDDLERYEKQTAALLERAPRAASRNRRERQKLVDENNALFLHHRQVVQTTKGQLASLMREMQEKLERAAAELLNEEVRRAKIGRYQKMSCGRCTSWQPLARGGIQILGT